MANNDDRIPPRIKDLRRIRADIDHVNDKIDDFATKMANVVDLGNAFSLKTGLDDISKAHENASKLNKKWADALRDRALREREITREIQEQIKKTGSASKEVEDLNVQLKDSQKTWKVIGKLIVNDILGALDKVGKTIFFAGIDSVLLSFKGIESGVLKVYDLMERTQKATGEFNESLGATTGNLSQLQKEGWKLEGALRGLSKADIGIGLKELSEATKAFGFTDESLSKFRSTAVMAGKAMGVGTSAAGEMARTFHLMGEEQKDVATSFMDISRAANAAGVPVSEFGKEVNASRGFMASFGKTGKKVFLESAAFAKKLGVSLKSLESLTDLTDTFESAAQAAAKMNTVFGTSTNSFELMMEQDPSKRLEMIRKQMFAQGKTFDNLSRQERKFFGETFKLSEEEVAAVLKRGITLDQFHAEQEKANKKKESDEAAIRKAMGKTATTLLNFGMMWDKVTRKIIELIKPFTDMLGLTNKGGKEFKSFGQVMTGAFDLLIEAMDKLAKDPKFQEMIKGWAKDFKDLATKVKDFVKDPEGLKKWAGDAVKFVGDFYDGMKKVAEIMQKHDVLGKMEKVFSFMVEHKGTILTIWAGFKAIGLVLGVVSGVAGMSKLAGFGRGLLTAATFLKSKFIDLAANAKSAAGKIAEMAVKGYEYLKPGLMKAGELMKTGMSSMWKMLNTNVGQLGKTLGGKLGVAGALAAAGLAGWELGTKLREWFPQIDTWMQKLMDGVTGFFDNLWKKIVHTRFYRTIFGDDAANAYDKADAAEAAHQRAIQQDRAGKQANQGNFVIAKPMGPSNTSSNTSPTSSSPKNYVVKPAAVSPQKSDGDKVVNMYLDSTLVGRALIQGAGRK